MEASTVIIWIWGTGDFPSSRVSENMINLAGSQPVTKRYRCCRPKCTRRRYKWSSAAGFQTPQHFINKQTITDGYETTKGLVYFDHAGVRLWHVTSNAPLNSVENYYLTSTNYTLHNASPYVDSMNTCLIFKTKPVLVQTSVQKSVVGQTLQKPYGSHRSIKKYMSFVDSNHVLHKFSRSQ